MAQAPDQHIIDMSQTQASLPPPLELQARLEKSQSPPSPSLQLQLETLLRPSPSPSPSHPSLRDTCIYKVPAALRKVNSDAYTPQLISIGPIHHGKVELDSMEDIKKSYLDFFWKRMKNEQADQEEYRSWLAKEEQIIRKCYSEKFTDFINGKEFVDIILLDSVFVMELLLRFEEREKGQHAEDFILSNAWRDSFIRRDLLLLENQLPLYVLDKLYTYLPVPDDGKGKKEDYKFVDIAEFYFENYYPQKTSLKSELLSFRQTKHFTDLVRGFYILRDLRNDIDNNPLEVLKTAKKLKTTGITFEAVSEKCLLDIDFKKGSLSRFMLSFSCIPSFNSVKARLLLPRFQINGATGWILRNLIAFEQCHYPQHAFICNYVTFFDYLIHSKEDVDLLVESQVIVHDLGSDEQVATLINGLCKNVVISNTCYKEKIKALNEHYSSSWNFAMTELRSVYYRDLWRGSSTIVGLAVLFFTFYNFFRNVFK